MVTDDVQGTLSAEEVAKYQRSGYLVTGLFLREDLLQAAEEALERLRSGQWDWPLPEAIRLFDRQRREEEPLEQYGYLALQMKAFAALVRQPQITASAAALTGCDEIRLFHDRLIIKHPEKPDSMSSKIGWHTDRAYWRTCSSHAMLTAWIPFQDCTIETGTLLVIEESHRWSGNDWMATAHCTDLEQLESQIATEGEPVRKTAYCGLKRGQITFHHCRTLHASGANLGSAPRVSWSVHLQDGANRYQPYTDSDGRRLGHLNDVLCRTDESGMPDYADPAVFPALHSGGSAARR